MIIYPLKASYGDALIIESSEEERLFRIVIDGGPEETADRIADCYCKLGHVDLLVLTHYDEDHIIGLIKYLESLNGNECVIDYVWANCASIIDYDKNEETAAFEEAYKLSRLLDALKRKGLIGEWSDEITNEMPIINIGPFCIEVLSPTKAINEDLKKYYREYIEREGLLDDPDRDELVSLGRVLNDASKSLDELASCFKPTTTTLMNKSSIAFTVKAEGKTVLCMADADAKVVEDALEERGITVSNPILMDLVKMSHHGSKSNIRESLFKRIIAQRFLFTTNGGTGGAYHPDRQTIACIDGWKNNKELTLSLYFNYSLTDIMKRNTGLLKEDERAKFNIVDDYPNPLKPMIEI